MAPLCHPLSRPFRHPKRGFASFDLFDLIPLTADFPAVHFGNLDNRTAMDYFWLNR
jgi:hypothetical protein